MATAKEVEKELAMALKEIGSIKPKFDKRTNDWGFSHKLYPVECGGATPEEVIEKYPLYLREFIKHRLENRLAPTVEKRTKGHGGARAGAGRPKGSSEEPKKRVYLPAEMALWLKDEKNLCQVTKLMRKCC